jgi:hypothetical protein
MNRHSRDKKRSCERHFARRLQERVGVNLSAEVLADIREDVLSGKAKFLGRSLYYPHRSSYSFVLGGIRTRVVFDFKLNTVVTVCN